MNLTRDSKPCKPYELLDPVTDETTLDLIEFGAEDVEAVINALERAIPKAIENDIPALKQAWRVFATERFWLRNGGKWVPEDEAEEEATDE